MGTQKIIHGLWAAITGLVGRNFEGDYLHDLLQIKLEVRTHVIFYSIGRETR